MDKFSEKMTRHWKSVAAFYALAALAGLILFFFVPVNYNMLDYLPMDANSTIALEQMEAEFEQPIPNLYVMAEQVSLQEALALKEKIREADFVEEVLWLDDAVDLKLPLQMQDAETVEGYYQNSHALFSVTVKNGKEQAAIASIRAATGGNSIISGSAADQAESQTLALGEAVRAMLVLIPLMLLLLILNTNSWIEPFLFFFTMGAAILLNLGSNIVRGEISFVTLAAAPVLQLAVSLDYVVFLSHSFEKFKQEGKEPKDAIRLALKESGKSISASMFTTMFGFMALMFMKFKIGSDMGISLVKGVIISFVCVMTLMPALLYGSNHLIEKTAHRRFFPEFKTIGNKIMKCYIPVAVLLVVIVVPGFLAQRQNHYFYGTRETGNVGPEAYQTEQVFGKMNMMVLLVPRGDSVKETQLSKTLEKIDNITGVISYASMVSDKVPSQFLEPELVSQFYSEHYARIILNMDCDYEGKEAFAAVEAVRAAAESYYPGAHYNCGQSANMYDMKDYVEADNARVNLITMISIYLVLLVMTKSWLIPLLLMLTIQCSIWLNMSVPYFTGSSLSYIGYLIVSTIQMGATVDYAILMTDHYMENRKSMERIPAMKKTLGDTFGSIIVSAITLAASGICLSSLSTNGIIQALGVLIGRGAVLALLLVVLLLPALFVLLDVLIPFTTWRAGFFKKENQSRKGEKI